MCCLGAVATTVGFSKKDEQDIRQRNSLWDEEKSGLSNVKTILLKTKPKNWSEV